MPQQAEGPQAVRPELERPVAPPPKPTPQAAPKPEKVKPEKAPRVTVPFLSDPREPDRMTRLQNLQEEMKNTSRPSPVAINIRGTSGSGKSHIVKSLIDKPWLDEHGYPLYTVEVVPDPEANRTPRDLMYILRPTSDTIALRQTAILGSYRTDCGGCDTWSSAGALDKIYGMVERQVTEYGRNVIFEGLIVCSDSRRSNDLNSQGFPIEIHLLNTPLEVCKANIDKRRGTKGPLLDHNNTVQKYEGNIASIARFAAAGLRVQHQSVDATESRIRQLLETGI